MVKRKISTSERRSVKNDARRLLQSPRFFNEFLAAVKKAGLVGEEKHALVLLVVAVSRLLQRPLNVMVKGQSAAGKNWLISRVLGLMPKDTVREVTSTSARAWNYSKDDFRHRVVYLHERNEATGAVHPTRLLISERKLVRLITGWEMGHLVTKKYVTRGPIASISTTTQNRLEIDDETRHISLWIDESAEQTRNILRAYGRNQKGLTRHERRVWRKVQRLLEWRAPKDVCIPRWFEKLADQVFANDVRVRRYFPAFVEACKAVCIIRSFQQKASSAGIVTLTFRDFAIATLIFDETFVESIHRVDGPTFETANIVKQISKKNKSAPIQACDLANELGISLDRAYERLRDAESAGVVRRANKPEKGNRKLYVAANFPRFLPEPKDVFCDIPEIGDEVKFSHPITGKWITYRRKSCQGFI